MRNKSIEESWSSYVIDYIAKTGACAYFLTLETKNWYTNGGGSFLSRRSVDRVHANFNSVYRHICSLLMKNHMRKLRFHPFAIAAVDMPGTRTGSVNLYVAPPHLHALLLIKPQHQARFQALVDTKFEALRQHNSMSWIHELDVEPVRKIYRVTSYACKFDRFAEARSDAFADIVQVYPITKSELSEPNAKYVERGNIRRKALEHEPSPIRRTIRPDPANRVSRSAVGNFKHVGHTTH